MSNTTYTNFTTPAIDAGWLNDVNNLVYNLAGDGVNAPANDSDVRTNLGLGTMATQNAGAVAITGGTIAGATITGGSVSGITDLAIADGGTGASTAAAARTNLNVPQIGPAFSANRATSDQTLTDAAYTEILFNSEDFDTDNYFNTATGRFTPLVAGYYLLNASVSLSGTAIANAQISLYKNGVAFKRGDVQVPGGTAPNAVSFGVSSLVFFNGTTDFASIWCYADVSAGSPLAGSAVGFTWFNGIFIRP